MDSQLHNKADAVGQQGRGQADGQTDEHGPGQLPATGGQGSGPVSLAADDHGQGQEDRENDQAPGVVDGHNSEQGVGEWDLGPLPLDHVGHCRRGGSGGDAGQDWGNFDRNAEEAEPDQDQSGHAEDLEHGDAEDLPAKVSERLQGKLAAQDEADHQKGDVGKQGVPALVSWRQQVEA